MPESELEKVKEIVDMLSIKKYERLQVLMPKIDTVLLFAIAEKLDEMNHKLLRILQEVD